MPSLAIALQITLIGMALIFGVIVVLWSAMALLVRFTPDRVEESAAAASESDRLSAKRRAAVAAVAIALAREQTTPPETAESSTAGLSVWQVAHRSRQLAQRHQQLHKRS